MGSNRRMAMRRDKREREKIQRSNAPGAHIVRARNKGWEDGKLLAIVTASECLYDVFSWNKQQIHELTERIAITSANTNTEVLQIAMQPWERKLKERIEEAKIDVMQIPLTDPFQSAYILERNRTYIAAAALIMLRLYSEFGFRDNKQKKGRMDSILDYFSTRLLDVVKKEEYFNIDQYISKLLRKTGLHIKR